MSGIRAVKGMRDLLPPETALWNHLEGLVREVFHTYGYAEIRTPLVEETQLFARSVGAETDIVSKEMYTFEDPAGRDSLTLRPEATASVVRAYIEHSLWQRPGVTKLYYLGPMFRRERPQKGRYRQFSQIGAEAIGSESPAVDAEMLEMLCALLDRAGLRDYRLLLNSLGDAACRPGYLEALRQALSKVKDQMCGDCRRRAETNPLRVLDCKVPGDQPIIESLPRISDYLCAPCKDHDGRLRGYLVDRAIPFTPAPRMVRGLDYYMRTTFEFVHESLGAQNSVLGGGRYDGLSEMLGGPKAPGIGFSIGEDRLVYLLGEPPLSRLDVFVAWLDEESFRTAADLARQLRKGGLAVDMPPERRKVGKLIEQASKIGARYVLMVGENERASRRYGLKNLDTGKQEELTLDEIHLKLKGA